MSYVLNKVLFFLNSFYNDSKNFLNIDLRQTYKNNVGSFRLKLFSDKASKLKFITVMYIYVTLTFCPFLDNLFNDFLKNEVYSLYYIIFFSFFLNFFLNFFFVIPTKNLISYRLLFLRLKSFFLYLNSIFLKLKKIFIFFKSEVLEKSTLFVTTKSFFGFFFNQFTYWRPLFKRFSYFGFLKLSKSKFHKYNK